MDGKPRGGKRLRRNSKTEWDPMQTALIKTAIIMCVIFLGMYISLSMMGFTDRQEAPQGGLQCAGGCVVVSGCPWEYPYLKTPQDWQEGDASAQPTAEATPAVDDLPTWTEDDLELLAQTIFAEAAICRTTKERAAVVWCVLNRLDDGAFGDTIREVVTARNQFAWTEDRPVRAEYIELAEDVLIRWRAEKAGEEDVGRVLPAEYLYFEGDGRENHFNMSYHDTRPEWGWTLPDPYGEG